MRQYFSLPPIINSSYCARNTWPLLVISLTLFRIVHESGTNYAARHSFCFDNCRTHLNQASKEGGLVFQRTPPYPSSTATHLREISTSRGEDVPYTPTRFYLPGGTLQTLYTKFSLTRQCLHQVQYASVLYSKPPT